MLLVALISRYKKRNQKKRENERELRATTNDSRRKRRRDYKDLTVINFSFLFSCFLFFMGMYLIAKTIIVTILFDIMH